MIGLEKTMYARKKPGKLFYLILNQPSWRSCIASLCLTWLQSILVFEDREKLQHATRKTYVSHRQKIGYFDLEIMLEELVQQLAIEADTRLF